jgi:hypothetical protein
MERTKVVEWVDIAAPCQDVFDLILNIERRMQLSPLWGVDTIEDLSQEYPQVGSGYLNRVKVGEEQEVQEYRTTITCNEPGKCFGYRLDVPRKSEVTWSVQEVTRGTRITYEESFLIDKKDEADFSQQVSKTIQDWLQNIKRYSELRGTRTRRFVRWLLDRFYLNMRQDQRKVVLALLVMQFVGMISFIMAAIALGIAGLI